MNVTNFHFGNCLANVRAMRMRKSKTTTSELLMSSMAPSVLSCSCHIAGREAERFLTELTLKLSEKTQMKYSIDRNSFAKRKTVSLNLL